MGDVSVPRKSWWIASAVGLPLAIPLGLALGAPLEVVVGMVLVTPIMLGLVGALLGASQWLVLRKRIEHAWWWIVASALGLSVGLTAGIVLVEQGGALITGAPTRLASTGLVGLGVSMLVIGVLGGSCAGAAQWLYLRRHSDATPAWVASTTVALSAGLLTGLGVAWALFGGITNPGGLAVFLILAGVVFGGVSSRALPTLRGSGPVPEGV